MIRKKYTHVEKFIRDIKHADVNIIQLSKFVKAATLTSVNVKDISIQEISFDCTVEHKGQVHENCYLFKLQKTINKGVHNGVTTINNSLILSLPGQEYTASSVDEYISITISIPKETIEEWFGVLQSGVFSFENNSLIEKFITRINKIMSLKLNNEFHQEYVYNLIMFKIGKLLAKIQKFDKQNKGYQRFNNISSFIKKNQEDDFSIKEIADYFNITDRTLRNIFMKEIGLSPKQYQTAIKMNILKKEIINNPSSFISNIINSSGMQYQSLLSKNFKELFGYTPKEYQNMFNNDNLVETIKI